LLKLVLVSRRVDSLSGGGYDGVEGRARVGQGRLPRFEFPSVLKVAEMRQGHRQAHR
jgi:hypothetical protein